MIRSLRALGALTTLAMAIGTFVAPVSAAPTISLVVTPPTDAAAGDPVSVDIFISGLTQALGGYAFDLDYDLTRMSFSSFVADPDTRMGDGLNPALDLSLGDGGGSVNFIVLSGFFDPADEAALEALQGGGFRLGSALFTALNNPGFASFGLSGVSLSAYDGQTSIRDFGLQGARLCVGAGASAPNGGQDCGNQVPEPMGALLVALGLGGLAALRRRQPLA